MVTNWFVTGDKHGNFYKILSNDIVQNPDNAIIILGDAGLNYYLNQRDYALKRKIMEESKCTWYLLRGNHEARPQSIPNMKMIFDKDGVDGLVWQEPHFDRIKYFLDYGEYWINRHPTLVIGGAYSVDKYYRLERAERTETNNNPKATGWFADEQLSKEEMDSALYMFKYLHYDFIMTHTCPLKWEPTDLFLNGLDQTTVDKTMEKWLDKVENQVGYECWLFAHYHADRVEHNFVHQLYNDVLNLEEIYSYWYNFRKSIQS